jgi:mutator protein MutT
VRGDEILLGRKKQHHAAAFGVGKLDCFGGKLEPGETVEQAAVRECHEESGVLPTKLTKVAVLNWLDDYNMIGHVFLCSEWQGEPTETAEMRPEWFNQSELPYSEMWDDDIFWLPAVLAGKKVRASFKFRSADDTMGLVANPVERVEIDVVESLA